MISDPHLQALTDQLGIDAPGLRARYRGERDRRLRADAVGQFVETTGENAHFADDPHADPTLRARL